MSTQKTGSANSRAWRKKDSALCTQYFWEYCTPPLHAISPGSNWEENYSVHSVLKCSRGSLNYLVTQGVAGIQHTRVSFKTGTASTVSVVLLHLAWTRLLIIFFQYLHWNWLLKGILFMPAALVTWTRFSSTKLIWIEMYKQHHNPDATSRGNFTMI